MQTQAAVEDAAAAYDARPWLPQYAAGVPASLEYPEQTVWELLEGTAATHGDADAFVFQNQAMSYHDIRDLSESMAGALSRLGVRRGDAILFLLPNVPHFPVTYFGALKLGAMVAAIFPTAVEREIENAIKDSGAKVVVTIDLLFDKVAGAWERAGAEHVIVGTVVDFMPRWKRVAGRLTGKIPHPKQAVRYGERVRSMREFLGSGKGVPTSEGAHPDDVAVLQYTGGTTGLPKAAMLTHRNVLSNARQMRCWFPTLRDGEETILGVLPLFHVYGVTLVMNTGLLMAARTVLIPRPVTSDIFDAIDRYRPSIFPGVPTLHVAVVNDERAKRYDLSSINICVSGGAPLPIELKRQFEALTGGHLYEGYGLSEASPLTHAEPCDGRSKLGSMGLPMPDTDVRILDDGGHCVPVGEEGELAVRGPQVMKGYWRRPEETRDVLSPDGWLRTGDVARMDEEGWFYIVDRKKDLIITGGENIYPREVEEVLFEHPAVKEAAVVGVAHPFGGQIAKAFIVLKPGAAATKRDITQFAAERLAKHKVPRAVEFRTELPKSAAQKVLRRVLADEERARQAEHPQRRRRAAAEE